MKKIPEQEYTVEFKERAVKRAQEVGIGVAARVLGLVEQTLGTIRDYPNFCVRSG